MKQDPFKKSLFVLAAAAIMYVASYAVIRLVKPECINTADGPIPAFIKFYYPLRYVDSEKPVWYWMTHDDWLAVKIDEINLGSGHLYFSWNGVEHRAFCGAVTDESREGDSVQVHLKYELVTLDDFRSRLVPTIDKIKRRAE